MNETQKNFFLVLLETSGNQNYIFSTNKLKENIGASELTYRVGTRWVSEVVAEINGISELNQWKNSQELRESILNPELNSPIETSDKPVEIIIATSGKALLLTKDKETAKAIIRRVTLEALKEAPGIDLCGVFDPFNWEEECGLVKAFERVYRKFQTAHSQIPSPKMRFLQIPMIQSCENSGLPASRLINSLDNQQAALSEISFQKQEHIYEASRRLNSILTNDQSFIRNINQLEKKFEELDWLAVVHADGNGLGQIFLNFEESLKNKRENEESEERIEPRIYINKLREFSLALDICTEQAFLSAINETLEPNQEGELPLVPLILGGDDLTVICEGKSALKFTKSFLENFEEETSKTQNIEGLDRKVIQEIAGKAFPGINRLSACAGVAIIKPHFPFSVAYQLAEDLIKEAKKIKKSVTQTTPDNKTQPLPCSAIDFHILYDSSDVQLSLIRDKLKINENTILHNRPYVVTSLNKIENAQGYDWAEFHHWDKLIEKVEVLADHDEEGRKRMPSSQAHELRTALFLGRDVADARYKLIYDRYQDVGIEILAGSKDSLFQTEPNTQLETTGLLDAIDAVEFLSSSR